MSRALVFGDWGTSRLRLLRMEKGAVVERRDGPGIGVSERPKRELLREALGSWCDGGPPLVVMCGMVGSRMGLAEVPYAPCPADQATWARAGSLIEDEDFRLVIAAGLSCCSRGGAVDISRGGAIDMMCGGGGAVDVMRGEETQIFGAMALDPALARGRSMLVLPGTHSKWAWVEDGVVTGFRSFPVGELFALLRDRSTLGMGAAGGGDGDEAGGFEHGLARAGEGPGVLACLFEARAASLCDGKSRAWAAAYLSGLLIGRELIEGQILFGAAALHLIGDPKLTGLYAQVCAARRIQARALDGEACAVAGLNLFHQVFVAEN